MSSMSSGATASDDHDEGEGGYVKQVSEIQIRLAIKAMQSKRPVGPNF